MDKPRIRHNAVIEYPLDNGTILQIARIAPGEFTWPLEDGTMLKCVVIVPPERPYDPSPGKRKETFTKGGQS